MSDIIDRFAERAVVGHLLAAGRVPEDIAEAMRPADLADPALRAVAEVAWDLSAAAEPVDPLTVRAELIRRGQVGQASDGVWLADLYRDGLPVAGAHHARIVRDLAVRRAVLAEATRTMQAAENPASDPYEIAAVMHVNLGVLTERDRPGLTGTARDFYDFLDGPTGYDWLVPDLLERGDRVLLTGVEGGGKSFLTRQLALCAAAGVHPFSGQPHDPVKVLLVDLENGERMLRRHFISLRQHADWIGRPVPLRGLTIESIPAGVDLATVDGEAWLTRLCEEQHPQLLVIGPLYRMHAGDMAKEEAARHLTRVVDLMRSRHRCAVLMETHAPHAGINGRSLRPVGSSLFMRWPEFGFGIKKLTDGRYKLVRWRGPRDERAWPNKLRRGGDREWPWVACDHEVSATWQDMEDEDAS